MRNVFTAAAALTAAAIAALGAADTVPDRPASPTVYQYTVGAEPAHGPHYGWAGPTVAAEARTELHARPARPEGAAALRYADAYRIAKAERRPLVVLAGPQAAALAEAVASEPDAVIAYGDPSTFPSAGVYHYRWDDAAGDLRGGTVPSSATQRFAARLGNRCGPGGCFRVAE